MSSDPRSIIVDENKKYDNVVTTYRRDVQFGTTPSYTSSLFVHLRQLQSDLQTQYQHEKQALLELNERFRHFIDRIQQLEAQNSKLISQIVNYRRANSDYSGVDVEWNDRYLHLQSDLTAASHGIIDFGLEAEMYQLQAAIYQQLIEVEQQYKDDRRIKLEQELNQSSVALNNLRASNSELGREVESLFTARDDTYKQYLRLTQEWTRMKRQGKEWEINKQLLKNQIAFYKNIRGHSSRGYTSLTVGTFDVKEYWAAEFEKMVKSIRRDFEQLYSTCYRDLTTYYNSQIEELKVEVEKAPAQTVEIETFSSNLQTIQVEYEQIQKTYMYEKEIITKLDATYSKLEMEYQSIQHQIDERLELQGRELDCLHENILTAAYDIEEMRQRKIHLEGEIIVYRHLLDSYDIREYREYVSPPPPSPDILTRKFVVKSQKKGSIGIRECPPDGAYISLINHSHEKNVDISRWVVKRLTDGQTEYRYTIPDGITLHPGHELRIYSRQGAAAAKASNKYRGITNAARQELVNNEINSWGAGTLTETFLINNHGDEKALFSQKVAVASSTI